MNLQELQAAWASWSHRDDLDATVLAIITELTTARLGRDLKTSENEVAKIITVPDGGYNLGTGFMEMRNVKGYRDLELTYMTPAQFFNSPSGRATEWTLKDAGLFFINGTGDATIDYWTTPDALVDPDDSNAVLTKWPNVYIYGGLVEIFRYFQDIEAAQQYGGFYNEEVKQTNDQAQRARIGNAPAMRAV